MDLNEKFCKIQVYIVVLAVVYNGCFLTRQTAEYENSSDCAAQKEAVSMVSCGPEQLSSTWLCTRISLSCLNDRNSSQAISYAMSRLLASLPNI